ncbi:MAG TPA: protein-disulfide reductase DsbD [Gammaproteobacteria bacterium]|jgi:thiol:disulfide interchange protein DsbD|nr:protein-disulfide reductase DsbD [Gammaproteobacteria bacterium]
MRFKLLIGLLAVLFAVTAHAEVLPAAINQEHMLLTLVSFFGVGMLLAFTPCVLPMVPILSSVLVGQKATTPKRAFMLSLVFVISMAFTYALAGMLAGYLGSTVQTLLQQRWIIISFSMVFVLMALSMFGLYDLALPASLQSRLHAISNKWEGGSYLGVAVMGILSTLIASPCVTAPLLSVLTYISQTGSPVQGGLILFVLALGMGVPLILFGIGQTTLLPKTGVWMMQVKKLFGVMMLGLAIWMLSRVVSGVSVMYLTSVLLIVSAIAFGALDFHADKKSGVIHGGSFAALVYGVLLLAGAASGHEDLLSPLTPLNGVVATAEAGSVRPPSSLFTYVDSLPKVKAKLAAAKSQHKPVMMEFFATWCPFCKQVDKEVLSEPEIRKSMKSFVTIRVDVSERNPELAKIMEEYNVFGVPTMVFYDKNGNLVDANNLNEGISKDNLQSMLTRLA